MQAIHIKLGKAVIMENREIINAYISDEYGNKVNTASCYVAIELAISPSVGSPFIFHATTQLNNWCNPYRIYIYVVWMLIRILM